MFLDKGESGPGGCLYDRAPPGLPGSLVKYLSRFGRLGCCVGAGNTTMITQGRIVIESISAFVMSLAGMGLVSSAVAWPSWGVMLTGIGMMAAGIVFTTRLITYFTTERANALSDIKLVKDLTGSIQTALQEIADEMRKSREAIDYRLDKLGERISRLEGAQSSASQRQHGSAADGFNEQHSREHSREYNREHNHGHDSQHNG